MSADTELEEVPMPIVGGLDIHRKQITFDYCPVPTKSALCQLMRPVCCFCQ